MEMIGLTEAKKIIRQALAYAKAQKLFSEKGMATGHLSMHMVFSGNPGTAKTTVARLFARIMRENNLLSKGDLIEVGRSDLIGKYVGWTAPMIQKKFRQAKAAYYLSMKPTPWLTTGTVPTAMKRSIPLFRKWKTTVTT